MRATLVERREYLLPEPTKEREREIRRKVNPIRRPLFVFGFPFFLRNNEFVLLRNTRPWTAVSHERSLEEDGILSFVGDR